LAETRALGSLGAVPEIGGFAPARLTSLPAFSREIVVAPKANGELKYELSRLELAELEIE